MERILKSLILLAICLAGCSENKVSSTQEEAKTEQKTPGTKEIVRNVRKDSVRVVQCYHDNLSDLFDYRILYKNLTHDSCMLDIAVIRKKSGKTIDSIHFEEFVLGEFLFLNCEQAYSYLSGKKRIPQVVDNNYGDFVVADFNFDAKEDFAVVNNIGGNGGPFYNFYLQETGRKFRLDPFLTDSMGFFPTEFNTKKRTLTTLTHASAYSVGKKVYRYNPRTGKWKTESVEMLGE